MERLNGKTERENVKKRRENRVQMERIWKAKERNPKIRRDEINWKEERKRQEDEEKNGKEKIEEVR